MYKHYLFPNNPSTKLKLKCIYLMLDAILHILLNCCNTQLIRTSTVFVTMETTCIHSCLVTNKMVKPGS